jgi:anaerobic selenocysteine-containing dehydrogenase
VTPDQDQVLADLARQDQFMVVHERFMTDAAGWADVGLPATSSLDHPDVYKAYGHYCARRVSAAVAPVGESGSSWDVFRALARAMEASRASADVESRSTTCWSTRRPA